MRWLVFVLPFMVFSAIADIFRGRISNFVWDHPSPRLKTSVIAEHHWKRIHGITHVRLQVMRIDQFVYTEITYSDRSKILDQTAI